MSTSMPVVDGHAAELDRRLDTLERRLNEVERVLGIEGAAAAAQMIEPEAKPPALIDSPATAAVLVGKSLFGLALAYLLRALTENHTLPVSAGVAVGLLYALAWLVWAARTPAGEIFTLSLRAATSVMIFIPLLWEATVRFGALPSWITGALLAIFAVFGLAISWRKNLTMVAWFTSLAALVACSALLVQSHDPVPYTAALLAMAAAVETSACLEHYLGERWVVALAADLVVLFMTYIATRTPGTLAVYPPIAAGIAILLLAILPTVYLGSTIVRTIGQARSITNFEIGQCVVAFLIAAWGSIQAGQGNPAIVGTIGAFCVIASVACYVVTFTSLERHPEKHRNFFVYSAFGLVLSVAAARLLLTGAVQTAILAGLCILLVTAGMNSGRVTLKLHAAAYIVFAVISSGLAPAANAKLLGGAGHAGATADAAMWIAAAAASLSYVLLLRGRAPERTGAAYLGVSAVLASTAFWSAAGLGALLLSPICRSGPGAAADYCPTVLTVLLVVCCLAAAYGARRFARRELTWVSLGLAGVAGYKLVVQDLHSATAFGVVISLIAYGVVLSVLPRLIRWTRANLVGVEAFPI